MQVLPTRLRDDARRGGAALDGGREADGAVAALASEAHLVHLVREVGGFNVTNAKGSSSVVKILIPFG